MIRLHRPPWPSGPNEYMVILALDTTTDIGSVALLCNEVVRGYYVGNAEVPHGRRLPGDVTRLLERQNVSIKDIDLYAVATGPGALTGLRVGIATVQGLAMANSKRVVAVSALNALALAARMSHSVPDVDSVGVLMDAHRGEVFSGLFGGIGDRGREAYGETLESPSVGTIQETLMRWRSLVEPGRLWLVGSGALASRGRTDIVESDRFIEPTPLIAPALGMIAAKKVTTALDPGQVKPLYIRPPDAVLARNRLSKK